MPRRWNRMTYEQITHRGLDAERRPGDLAQICAMLAEIRAAKAARGEPIDHQPAREPIVYRIRLRRRR